MAATAAKQAVATAAAKPEPEAAPKVASREVLPLKTAALEWQYEGHRYREAIIRLPANVILQDLNDAPQLWRSIQSTMGKALSKFDEVTLIAFDESWIVRKALVVEADSSRVKLHIKDVVRLGSQTSEWIDTDRGFCVKWGGGGYGAYRLADGIEVIPPTWSTLDAAKAQLFREHYAGRRVA